jgi:hypothetical protein
MRFGCTDSSGRPNERVTVAGKPQADWVAQVLLAYSSLQLDATATARSPMRSSVENGRRTLRSTVALPVNDKRDIASFDVRGAAGVDAPIAATMCSEGYCEDARLTGRLQDGTHFRSRRHEISKRRTASTSFFETRRRPVLRSGSACTRARNCRRFAYADSVADVYRMPYPSPYFLADGCSLHAADRENVTARCAKAARFVRRELSLPGWRAGVDRRAISLDTEDTAFQSVALPAGLSHVTFAFEPPHMTFGYVAFFSASHRSRS